MPDPLERFRPVSQRLAQSVLDRLLDDEPDRAQDPLTPIGAQVKELREAIRCDLEALLNTRRCPQSPPSFLGDLGDSLLSYGVDGFVSANLLTDAARAQFAYALERRIALFETRLSDVRVTVLRNRAVAERALRLRIDGYFRLHDGMPPISFESTMDPSTQRFLVEAPNG